MTLFSYISYSLYSCGGHVIVSCGSAPYRHYAFVTHERDGEPVTWESYCLKYEAPRSLFLQVLGCSWHGAPVRTCCCCLRAGGGGSVSDLSSPQLIDDDGRDKQHRNQPTNVSTTFSLPFKVQLNGRKRSPEAFSTGRGLIR